MIGRVLQLPSGRAWLNEDGSGGAITGFDTPAQLQDWLVVSVAGGIAECLLLNREPWFVRDRSDRADVANACARAGLDRITVTRARRRARQLVRDHAVAIKRVARELRKQRRLTGSQIDELISALELDFVVS